MTTVKFAFYEPVWNDLFGQSIAWYTRLFNWGSKNYCHVEIGLFIKGEWCWYSSASRNANGKSGTRWISELELFKHPERWDIIEVEAKRPLQDMIDTCNAELGKPYDWSGLAGFITPSGFVNEKEKWYCSEICQYVFTGKWVRRVSPERLFNQIKNSRIR